jgi:phosphatidylglycerophosphate synthase
LVDKSEVEPIITPNHPTTLQDRVRKSTSAVTHSIGAALHRLGVHPDVLTVAGTLLCGVGAVFIGLGNFNVAALMLALGLPFDALDGAVARAMGRQSQIGAILDSTLDRYTDGLIFAGFACYFAAQDELNYMLLALAALIGSFVVSYVRARAGEAGLAVRVGLLDRMARLALILAALLLPTLIVPALAALALGSHITVGQRLWHVYKHLD